MLQNIITFSFRVICSNNNILLLSLEKTLRNFYPTTEKNDTKHVALLIKRRRFRLLILSSSTT